MRKILLVGWYLVVLFQVVPAWGMEKITQEQMRNFLLIEAQGGIGVAIDALSLEEKRKFLEAAIGKLGKQNICETGRKKLYNIIYLCAQYDKVVQEDKLKDVSLADCERIIAGIKPFTHKLSRNYSMIQQNDWKEFNKRETNLSVGLRTELIQSHEKNGCYEPSLFLPDLPSGCLDGLDKQKVVNMFDTCLEGENKKEAEDAKQILKNLTPSDLNNLLEGIVDKNIVAKIKRSCTREKIRLTCPEELSWKEHFANFASWFTPMVSATCFWWVGKLLKTNGKNKWAKVGALAAAGVGTMWAEKKINKHFERYGSWGSYKFINLCALCHGYRKGSPQQNIQQVVKQSFEKQI